MTSESMPIRSEHGILPLAPIERPRGLFVRLLYFATRMRYGKTPTAFRVVYSRKPAIGFVSLVIVTVLDYFLSIEKNLRLLLQTGMAMQNGCTFCADLYLAEAIRAKVGTERFAGLPGFEAPPAFTPREKAALAYGAAVATSLRVEDAVFERLKAHFNEKEIVEIVWICAVERYFNSMALPLRIGSDNLASLK